MDSLPLLALPGILLAVMLAWGLWEKLRGLE